MRSGRLRLVHADSHHESVGWGGEHLQGRAASALQGLSQDVRGRVPTAAWPRAARHLPGYGAPPCVQRHLTSAACAPARTDGITVLKTQRLDSSAPAVNHHITNGHWESEANTNYRLISSIWCVTMATVSKVVGGRYTGANAAHAHTPRRSEGGGLSTGKENQARVRSQGGASGGV